MSWRCAALAVVVGLSGLAHSNLYSRAYGPQGTVLLARPELKWQVRTSGETQIDRVWCTIDGKQISGRYDAEQKLALSIPESALSPGTYTVEMGVVANNGLAVRKKWEITVGATALLEIPSYPEPKEFLDAVANFRAAIGMDVVQPRMALNAAAQLHAEYLEKNNVTGHTEKEGNPGYFGESPSDRVGAFGYIDGVFEVVQYGRFTAPEAVKALIAAPYHRIPFLSPGRMDVGFGVSRDRHVIVFGQTDQTAAVVYPLDGQKEVPTAWEGLERPDPLRLHDGLKRPTGYPIMLTYFDPTLPAMTLKSASLKSVLTGTTVDCALNHPGNDDQLTQAVILIPRAPLAAGMQYEATVEVELETGDTVKKTWTFTTAAGN